MAIPKENRQQMINMMYLVLTAMLALNVSVEILNAFKTINTSLENSNKIADSNIKTTYGGFAIKRAKEPANQDVQKYEALAIKAMEESKSLESFVEGLKNQIVTEAGGPGKEGAIMEKLDDIEPAAKVLVGTDEKKSGQGYVLKKKIEETLNNFLSIADPKDRDLLKKDLTLNTDSKGDWVMDQFGHMPAVAAYAMLTKTQNDIKNAEARMISYCYSKIGDAKELEPEEIVLDQFSAQVASPSAYVLQGETFEANVFLAASSSESSVTVSVNGASLPVKDGVGTYKTSGSGIGEHPLNGVVSVRNNRTGKVTSYKTPEFKYTVAAPFATVAPTKMNVFYIGVDNPVDISAAGCAAKDLQVSMSAGNISGAAGKYTVRVSTQGTTNVNVVAKGKNYGAFPFRVKMIPNPIAKVSGMAGGRVNAGVWRAQKGVVADLENFDIAAKFDVVSFNMFYQPKMADPGIASATGPYFSAAMQAYVSKAKPGDIFYIEDIKVKGPAGDTRKIPGVAFKID